MNTTTTTTTAAAKRSSTLYMVELAMMIAIILLMSFTPLGYLRTPGLSITLLTIPVAVGAIILGPKGGAVCGLAFGATSFYMAVTGSSAFAAALFNINPFGTFIVCIVARVLEGWITGLIFAALYKSPAKKFSYYVASLDVYKRQPPRRKEFHDVIIPHIPPTMITLAIIFVPKAWAMASAVTSPVPC